jgi:hypothetical protein
VNNIHITDDHNESHMEDHIKDQSWETTHMERITRWLRRTEEFLDSYGLGAWIAAFVLGFIFFWPLGLAILGYTLWSGRMGCWNSRRKQARRTSGNTAFDDYREETLRRLEEEQSDFEGFLERLRRAKDKSQFEQFMSERARPAEEPTPA